MKKLLILACFCFTFIASGQDVDHFLSDVATSRQFSDDMIQYHKTLAAAIRSYAKTAFDEWKNYKKTNASIQKDAIKNLDNMSWNIDEAKKEMEQLAYERSEWIDREFRFVHEPKLVDSDETFSYDEKWADLWTDYERKRADLVKEIRAIISEKGSGISPELDAMRARKEALVAEGKAIWEKIESEILVDSREDISEGIGDDLARKNEEQELHLKLKYKDFFEFRENEKFSDGNALIDYKDKTKRLRNALKALLWINMNGVSRQSKTDLERMGEKKIIELSVGRIKEVRFITFETILNYLPLDLSTKLDLKILSLVGEDDEIFARFKKSMVSPPFSAKVLKILLTAMSTEEIDVFLSKVYPGISEADKSDLIAQKGILEASSDMVQDEDLVRKFREMGSKYGKDKLLFEMDIVQEFNQRMDSEVKKILSESKVGRNVVLAMIAHLEAGRTALEEISDALWNKYDKVKDRIFLNIGPDNRSYSIVPGGRYAELGISLLNSKGSTFAGIDPEKFEASAKEDFRQFPTLWSGNMGLYRKFREALFHEMGTLYLIMPVPLTI